MNLSARERQALRSIEGGLAESDPDLAARLAKLSRLIADEDTPPAEQSRVSWPRVVISSLPHWLPRARGRRHACPHSRWVSAMLALWLVVSCALIATAAALSHSASGGACAALAVHCDTPSPAGHSQPGAR